jgi:hypothetical protein
MPTATIILWNHEPVYESPARKSFTVNWEGELVRADASFDFDPNFWLLPFGAVYLNKIVINGTEVSWVGDPNDVVTFDARPYLRRGTNYIEIYHNAREPFGIPLGIQTAGLYAYIVVESTGSVGGEVAPSDGGLAIPSWVWTVLIILVVLVLIIGVLRR